MTRLRVNSWDIPLRGDGIPGNLDASIKMPDRKTRTVDLLVERNSYCLANSLMILSGCRPLPHPDSTPGRKLPLDREKAMQEIFIAAVREAQIYRRCAIVDVLSRQHKSRQSNPKTALPHPVRPDLLPYVSAIKHLTPVSAIKALAAVSDAISKKTEDISSHDPRVVEVLQRIIQERGFSYSTLASLRSWYNTKDGIIKGVAAPQNLLVGVRTMVQLSFDMQIDDSKIKSAIDKGPGFCKIGSNGVVEVLG